MTSSTYIDEAETLELFPKQDLIMRQVPHYLIIGNGRVSKHFQHYFALRDTHYTVWHRQQSEHELHHALLHATHILVLISDQAIDPFIQTHLSQVKQPIMHCSGSLVTQQAYGVHPLMTFAPTLYHLERYQAISFVIDHDAPDFSILFPTLSNPHVRLLTSLKSKYHALCVLSGNFSCLLWQKLFSTLEKDFQIPAEMAHLYLSQQTENLLADAATALTGPLVRRDHQTIRKNLQALENDPFQAVYESFINCYEKLI
jgi:predicted short-subunit dehydrogenase-like oxidoreductase (DUF2520 family)